MAIALEKFSRCGVILRVGFQQSSNANFELAGWTGSTPKKIKAVSEDLGFNRLFLLLKPLLYDNKDFINHCQILHSFFFDVLLGVTFLKVNKLRWCCYGITFGKFKIKLAHVNRSSRGKSLDLTVHFAQGHASSVDHHLTCETSRTRRRN